MKMSAFYQVEMSAILKKSHVFMVVSAVVLHLQPLDSISLYAE